MSPALSATLLGLGIVAGLAFVFWLFRLQRARRQAICDMARRQGWQASFAVAGFGRPARWLAANRFAAARFGCPLAARSGFHGHLRSGYEHTGLTLFLEGSASAARLGFADRCRAQTVELIPAAAAGSVHRYGSGQQLAEP